jgi:hypothetical protein
MDRCAFLPAFAVLAAVAGRVSQRDGRRSERGSRYVLEMGIRRVVSDARSVAARTA